MPSLPTLSDQPKKKSHLKASIFTEPTTQRCNDGLQGFDGELTPCRWRFYQLADQLGRHQEDRLGNIM